MEKNDIIYHYTDGSGLTGILESQSLRATHFRYLNDKTELELYKEMLLFSLRKQQVSQNMVERFKEYIETVSGLVFDRQNQHLCDIFICSFCFHNSHNKDFSLLSQWRGYGKDGGYAIGFDYEYLNNLKEKERTIYDFDFATFDPVTYWDKEAEIPEEQKENVEFILTSYIKGHKNGQLREASDRYLRCLAHVKHDGFNEENEYRLVFGFKAASTKKEIKFRNYRGTLIPYIQLFKEDGRNLPIRKIIIGPSPDADLRRKAIELWLYKKELPGEVVISAIPYRGA